MNRDEIIKAAEEFQRRVRPYIKTGGVLLVDVQTVSDQNHALCESVELIRSLIALVPGEGMVSVPEEPTEEQWGGLARDVMMWMDMNSRYTPDSLVEHLTRCGHTIPQWLLDEPEMQFRDHSMSKGTRCVIIYKAMLKAAKEET